MNKNSSTETAPTMIIPRDTEIRVDGHGQLSIRAPGNLVLQNSGTYGTLESVSGSIRIEPEVEVEAVSVRCAQTCYVQGSLTAWKVSARSLSIEETGRAHIVLQETGSLSMGRDARLVGNFGSEKELFLLFSRFADQVRSLPFFPGRREDGRPAVPASSVGEREEEPASRPRALPSGGGGAEELPEPLYMALVLLEREAERKSYGPTSQRALEGLVELLQERDLDTLRQIHRTLFNRIVEPRDDVRRARELVEQACGGDAVRAVTESGVFNIPEAPQGS